MGALLEGMANGGWPGRGGGIRQGGAPPVVSVSGGWAWAEGRWMRTMAMVRATAWKNVGLNLGLTAIGMIPGARFMKLAKSAKSARGLTKSAETAIQAAQKAGKLPIGEIAGEMTQKAL